MGKKEKSKKKGKGAEKTADKTEKKIKLKLKKTMGEDDIESVVKAIEEEERKRQEVKEISLGEVGPSHRSNLSFVVHPENPDLIMFGGEFYNGQKTQLNNELLSYDVKRKEWKEIKSPAGPANRCSHQAVVTAQAGGQMWVFGGEFASPSESQFHHYKDLWVFHFNSRRWEKISAKDGPSSRSGHRMVLVKRHIIVFGGFHDNPLRGGEAKYFNDVHAFDTQEMKWKKLEISGVKPPSPRSGCNMFVTSDGRIVIYGGYCKEKLKTKVTSGKKGGGADSSKEVGKTLNDMFLLVPDKHDETMTKWRWYNVKQTGNRPNPRSGIASAVVPNSTKAFFFGGVNDEETDDIKDDDSDEDDDVQGSFYNDLYVCSVENEKATWQKIELTGIKTDAVNEKKRRRGNAKQINAEQANNDCGSSSSEDVSDSEKLVGDIDDVDTTNRIGRLEIDGENETRPQIGENNDDFSSSVRVVEDGAFTISSTVIHSKPAQTDEGATSKNSEIQSKGMVTCPSPRFGSCMVIRQGILFLFGGMFEDEEDRQLTLKDFYCLDTKKLDSWTTLIESDIKTMEWIESDDEDDDDEDESTDEDGEDMDTN